MTLCRITVHAYLGLLMGVLAVAGCGGGSSSPNPLSAANVNLIFVVSPDLAYHGAGDIDPGTANLTSQGLQRSLLMATYLKQQVLGGRNVTAIYALEPMTHLQTANKYPDMAAITYIQQFAMLNQIALSSAAPGSPLYTGNSYPINVSYASVPLPDGVVTPTVPSTGCQGIDFNDTQGDNDTLIAGIITAKVPGFYVFSAPWETVSALLAKIKSNYGLSVSLPSSYSGPNHVYAISVTPSGNSALVAYNSNLNPPSTYPKLPSPVPPASGTQQLPFCLSRTGGVNGAVIPANINKNETVYLIRHAEAHPTTSYWDDGNYVAAGQWRALALPSALQGKIHPTMVYSIDPAQAIPYSQTFPGMNNFSYVRPSLTVQPYAIANNLPFYLVSEFELSNANSPQMTSDYFFTGGRFSNQTILLAWEHGHFPPIVNALLAGYQGTGKTAPSWPGSDYDTIWTVRLDDQGNVTVNNILTEGIDSAGLPADAPQF